MEFWFVYDRETGRVLWRGATTAGGAAGQQIPETASIIVVPQSVFQAAEIDLDVLRPYLARTIDAEAEMLRKGFLTPGEGQAMTYQRKEAEARAWVVDNSVATPFLNAEAPARGMTLAELAAEVIQLADAWVVIGSAIEGLRMGAKSAMARAETLEAVLIAATVDWSKVGQAALPAGNG